MSELNWEQLPENLRNFQPKYLWEVMDHAMGYTITHEEFNQIWNLIRTQGDYNTNILKALIESIDHIGGRTQHIITSSQEPDDSQGDNGDIWIQYQD